MNEIQIATRNVKSQQWTAIIQDRINKIKDALRTSVAHADLIRSLRTSGHLLRIE